MSALPGILFVAGVVLLLFTLGSILAISLALAGLAPGRRALQLQLVALAAFLVSASTRTYLLFAAGEPHPLSGLVLGVLDAFLCGLFWWSLTRIRALIAGPAPIRWSPWPMVALVGMIYVGVSTLFWTIRENPISVGERASGVFIVGLFGLSMIEIHRMLRIVERPNVAILPLVATWGLALPMFAPSILTAWFPAGFTAGLDLEAIQLLGAPVAGIASSASAVMLLAVVARADVAGEVTRRVLSEAAAARGEPIAAPTAPVADSRRLVTSYLDESGDLVHAEARAKVCRECGIPLEGIVYHSHDLPGLVGPAARDLGVSEDAYRALDAGAREELIRRKAATGHQNR